MASFIKEREGRGDLGICVTRPSEEWHKISLKEAPIKQNERKLGRKCGKSADDVFFLFFFFLVPLNIQLHEQHCAY